jgi:dipeptidase E
METHIFAMGGGGYYGPKGGPSRMFLEVLKTTNKRFPKICLIPTANGDRPDGIQNFIEIMNKMGAHPNYLSLFATPTRDLESWLLDFDAIYISGGNTKNLLALWREWSLDKLLIKALQAGVVISGASAGANCWFEESSSDFIPGEFNPLQGLGLLKGSFCPHYSDEKGRRESYLEMIKTNLLKPGYAVSDRAALHFVNGNMQEVLVEWDLANAFQVSKNKDGSVFENKLVTRIV